MADLFRYTRKSVFSERQIPIFAQLNRQIGSEPPHDHDFIEFVFAHKGTAVHETITGRRSIKPGDLLVLRPETWHAYHNCNGFEIYNCCFGPELLREELSWLIHSEVLGPLLWGRASAEQNVVSFRLDPAALARSVTALRGLIRALAEQPSISRHEAIARLGVVLTALPLPALVENKAGPRPRLSHPLVLTCLRQMEGALERDWRLSDLACENGVSREHLIRMFKQKIGLPPMAYLDRCRAERAADLLKRTSLSIGVIGEKVGWESPVTFSRRFKFHFGVSASVYRARGQKII